MATDDDPKWKIAKLLSNDALAQEALKRRVYSEVIATANAALEMGLVRPLLLVRTGELALLRGLRLLPEAKWGAFNIDEDPHVPSGTCRVIERGPNKVFDWMLGKANLAPPFDRN